MLHIIYHPDYLKYSFGAGHPFWPQRAQEFLGVIRAEGMRYELREPQPASDADITLAHTPEYLTRVKHLARTGGALSIDTPLNEAILRAAYVSVGGTILASRLALEGKRVMNLLGGLHHASVADSSGFCVFNDQAIAIRKLQSEQKIRKAFVFDIDVHAGQGTQEIFYADPTVFTLSIHQDPHTLYPGTGFPEQLGTGKGKGYNRNIILKPGTGEDGFLRAVREGLNMLREFKPELILLVFGADTYKEDPLANLKLELTSYEKLGKLLRPLDRLGILCAGGYSRKVPQIWLSFLKGFLP